MRASTLLGIAIALFMGVAVVAGVRYSGILDRTPPVPEKPIEPFMVLVAKRNLLKDITLTSFDATTRPATAAELSDIKNNLIKNLLPASSKVEAAQLLVAKRNIYADEILVRSDFRELTPPLSVSERLSPGMKAVDLVLPRELSGGGLLRIGEYVDVLLTSVICTDASCSSQRQMTAPLAKNLKIIVKRDNLNTVLQVPDDKPVSFILEANPYRAALIEYAKSKGLITLQATTGNDGMGVEDSKEEEERKTAFISGKSPVTEDDLKNVFNLEQSKEPPLAAPRKKIEHWIGARLVATSYIDPPGRARDIDSSFTFHIPGKVVAGAASSSSPPATVDKYCPNCEKNRKR